MQVHCGSLPSAGNSSQAFLRTAAPNARCQRPVALASPVRKGIPVSRSEPPKTREMVAIWGCWVSLFGFQLSDVGKPYEPSEKKAAPFSEPSTSLGLVATQACFPGLGKSLCQNFALCPEEAFYKSLFQAALPPGSRPKQCPEAPFRPCCRD